MMTFILFTALSVSLIYNLCYYNLYKTYEDVAAMYREESRRNFQAYLDLFDSINNFKIEPDDTDANKV